MSDFDLVPVDGGAAVHLPSGETVLGRGPLLGVSDKRVSRQHALLENLDGRLRLKSTHVNPCFVQSSITDEPRPLTRDSWWTLQDGDLFSLLPGHLIYRVVTVGGVSGTHRGGQTYKEDGEKGAEEKEEELPSSRNDFNVDLIHPIPKKNGQTQVEEEEEEEEENEEEEVPQRSLKKKEEAALEEKVGATAVPVSNEMRRRVLPAWMMANAPVQTFAIPHKVEPVKKRKVSEKRTIPAAVSPERAELSEEVEEKEEEEEEEERPRKKRRNDEEVVSTPRPAPVAAAAATVSRVSGVSESEEEEEEEAEENRKWEDEGQVDEGEDSVGLTTASTPKKQKARRPCPYGKDCYRKNPVHFQECSHPGDTDYEEEEDEDKEEDLPECPYGTDCYRKNPQHRKEYKHSKRPVRAARKLAREKLSRDEDEDEYDDSFIDDDSEDLTGEDSDYVPLDSDDSGKEDIKRLQKEAKVFLKRKK